MDFLSRFKLGMFLVCFNEVRRSDEFNAGAIELNLETPPGNLYFMADNFNIDYAHTLVFGWTLNYRL
jgi:hypothetical protein